MAGCSACIRTADTHEEARQKVTFSPYVALRPFLEVEGSMVVSQASNVIKWLIEMNQFLATLF